MLNETITIGENHSLATKKVSKLVLLYALPAVLSMLVDAVYNIADQIFIGHGVGYLGITATTVAFPFVTIILAVSTMLGIGGSVYTSMRMGENKNEEAEKMLGTVFTLAAVIGILFTVICLIFLKPIVYFFGATEASLPYVLDYSRIILIGAPFSMVAIALSSMARADGSPVFVMNCFLVGTILDLIFNPIYIFALGWGVKGAAISTVASQILTAVVLVYYFLKKGHIRLKAKNLCPSPAIFGTILAFGVPACMIQIADTLFQIVLNNVLRSFGAESVGSEVALSTMGIVLRINSVIIAICVGIAIGVQPILGFNKGAGLHSRVKEVYKITVGAATVISTVGWIIYILFPVPILGLFGMKDASYLDFAVTCIRIFLFGMFTAGFQIVTANYFLATGQAFKSLVFSVLRPLLLMVPFLLILPHFLGMNGILYSGAIASLLTPAIMSIFVIKEFRKNGGRRRTW